MKRTHRGYGTDEKASNMKGLKTQFIVGRYMLSKEEINHNKSVKSKH